MDWPQRQTPNQIKPGWSRPSLSLTRSNLSTELKSSNSLTPQIGMFIFDVALIAPAFCLIHFQKKLVISWHGVLHLIVREHTHTHTHTHTLGLNWTKSMLIDPSYTLSICYLSDNEGNRKPLDRHNTMYRGEKSEKAKERQIISKVRDTKERRKKRATEQGKKREREERGKDGGREIIHLVAHLCLHTLHSMQRFHKEK